MKRIILLSFILFGFVKVDAQTTVSRSSIGITLGPSFPIGYFGKTEGSKSGGLAKVGGFLAIDYVYQFSSHFGLVLSGQGRRYGIDKDALNIHGVSKEINEAASFSAGTWRTGAIMGGIFHVLPLTKTGRLNFELKIMAGFQRTSSPDISTTVMVMGTQLQQKSIASNAFAYLVGVGVRQHLTKKLALKFNADYYGSNPEFRGGVYIGPTISDMRRDTEAINVGVGLVVDF
ncbi:hypothetical protein [Pedobacter sp. Hv1]|uniref:hypothetical protein n=1 Tax=Pedobacter sp. Hv1 TaxID=1740090 RepID=UPI0006D8CA47|nr:hypothetical protein [Pedobacter sp. Hv1]KQC00660.1 hypothetical protein AQF98_08230 [Pedobacter sp. Hv1]